MEGAQNEAATPSNSDLRTREGTTTLQQSWRLGGGRSHTVEEVSC
jgi:hypothetical protein